MDQHRDGQFFLYTELISWSDSYLDRKSLDMFVEIISWNYKINYRGNKVLTITVERRTNELSNNDMLHTVLRMEQWYSQSSVYLLFYFLQALLQLSLILIQFLPVVVDADNELDESGNFPARSSYP